MAKKRKGGPSKGKSTHEDDPNKRVRLNVNSYEDVAGSDDEFHLGRDKVLLEEAPNQKRLRKAREREAFLEASDEEVLGHSDQNTEDQGIDVTEDDDIDQSEDDRSTALKPKANLRYSDEEDQGAEDDEDDDLNEWGASKQDYYGADEMATEQDALDEEAEAKRLQKKQLEGMTAADYGFDEDEWAGRAEEEKLQTKQKKRKTVTEFLPELRITDDMGPAERLKLLKSRYPEFEPLSNEFSEVQDALEDLRKRQTPASAFNDTPKQHIGYRDRPATALDIMQRAASAYLATLGMYFALLSAHALESQQNKSVSSANTIRDHPVMESLLSLRELWLRTKAVLGDVDQDDEPSEPEEETKNEAETTEQSTAPIKPKKRTRKSRAEKQAAAAQRAADQRRTERLARAEADLADLDALLAPRPKTKTERPNTADPADADSDFGERALTDAQLAAKAAKRKSLRFYTSQIAQKANRRGAAGRTAGGDDDIPYRERLRDRQARLVAEAAARGRGKGSAGGDELGGASDEEDAAAARRIRDEVDGVEGGEDGEYYQYIAGRAAERKRGKEELAAARKEAVLNGGRVVEDEVVGPDGKRRISYAIEKNKGLTPRRKKEVRNPRVKKRKRFEDRKKKLATMKAVYKGGEGRGGYGGELTGIKTGLVKSRKL